MGGRLTADTTGITDRNGLPTSFTYRWFRSDGTNETPISGPSSRLRSLTTLDAGHRIKVEVSFTDQDGFSESVKSEFTPKVGAINHAATGKPTITGDLETGAELTAATTGIQDQNGLPGTFAYQWFRSDGTGYAPIDEATESTYILASGDVGRRVKVRVTFTDNDGFSESLESDHTSPVAAKNIAATGKPTISGELRTGAILEVDISGIRDQNGLPDTFAYQWFRSDGTNDTPIDEATKSSYTLASEDGGQRIKVQVTFTDKNGFPESRDSDLTAVINHSATGRPTISGSLVVGGTLTADSSEIADRNGLPGAFSYQWHHGAGDTPIAGATGSTYALTEADKGKSIRVEVSFVDSDGNQETLSSDLTEEVAAVDHPATGAVFVQGVLETGKTLRADTTAIADQNGLPPASSFRYQWFRGTGADETEINGAIESDYNLVSEDAGHHMKVVVPFTDRDGFEESIPSAFTQGTVLEVSVLTTEEGYAPRKLTFLDYRPVNFLSWRNPSRAPYPSYHDDNEVVHRFEVQQRTRDLGQAWTGREGLSLPEPPPRDSYNAVKLVVDGAGRCQDREWRVRALYNDPQRHSEWVIAGEHNRPADGPPGGAVPDVAGSWLTVVGDSYQLGFSWRTVSRNCAWVTGWDVERRHHRCPADEAINSNSPDRCPAGEGPTSNSNRRTGPRTKDQRQLRRFDPHCLQRTNVNSASAAIPSWATVQESESSSGRTRATRITHPGFYGRKPWKKLDPRLQPVVALPLTRRSRADALLQRPLQGLPHPPGQLPRLRALGHRPLVQLQHPRRALEALVPHQLFQQRHQPHVVHVLDVSAVFDAVFSGFHRLSSLAKLRPRSPVSCGPGFPSVFRHFLGDVMHPHFNRIFRGLMSLRRRSNRPADVMPHVWRCHCSPEHRNSTKCFLFTSCRGRFTPVSAMNSRLWPLCYQTQTPVHPQYCTKGVEKKRVYSPPHPCAEPRGNGL